ncbi:MAG: hypothetical protein U9P80_10625 [Thermodesulfobacteriota bacterium]|nr:hypothetical protein [Thermodesulfobacteriota bacterium]
MEDLPIILISGFSDPDALQRAEEIGVVEFIEKPFTSNTLSAAIHRALYPKYSFD